MRRVSYVPAMFLRFKLAGGNRYMLEVSPHGTLRLRKDRVVGPYGSALWEFEGPVPIREKTDLARRALELATESIENAITVRDLREALDNEVEARLNDLIKTVTAGQTTKKCPYCAETILLEAKKCRYCGEFLETEVIAGTSPSGYTVQAKAKTKAKQKRRVAENSGCVAAFLSFLFPPLGLWYKGQWMAGFAWLFGGILFIIATGFLLAPVVWIGSIIHAAVSCKGTTDLTLISMQKPRMDTGPFCV